MSEQAASDWLKNHPGSIPAFDDYHQQVVKMLQEGVASMGEIADIIMFDPGLSATILRDVNSKLKNSHRPVVETVHTAMGHLGKPAIAKLVNEHPILSSSDPNIETINRYRQLLSQNKHALAQLDSFAQIQGISTVDDMRAAMLLHNLGEFYLCLFDIEKYQAYRQALTTKQDIKKLAEKVFGFDFGHLGKFLSQHWHLPELVMESFKPAQKTGRKARLIQLAGAISRAAELSWYNPAMQEAQKSCASYLNLTTDETWFQIQTTALGVARDENLDNVMPAASRLILLPDVDMPAEKNAPKPVTEVKSPPPSFENRLRLLLQSRQASQSQVINLLLDNLHQELGFSRVVLMLLSGDKSTLATRTGKGLDKGSPFLKLQLDVVKSGILKSLLQKPQAVCINATTYRKYENSLPGQFKATCLCDNFIIMSIFIGNRPIGLIYCDRSISRDTIDKASYGQFKANIMMTSKALSFLAKRKTQAAA